MASSPAFSKQNFFNNNVLIRNAPIRKIPNALVLVDVGESPDSGFRAIAVALIDGFMGNKAFNNTMLSQLLACHFALFPHHSSFLTGLSARERMQQLIKQVSMSELIQTLAYTLRQLAVDEMNQYPFYYRDAFIKAHEVIAPETLRNSCSWVSPNAVAALAYKLDLPIEIKETALGKELPKRLKYNEQGENPGVVLSLQNDNYAPYVGHAHAFLHINKVIRSITPMNLPVDDHKISEIMKLIAADDKRLLTEFKNFQHRLEVMVNANEINDSDLFKVYIKVLSMSYDKERCIRYIGAEHGTASFFEAIERATSIFEDKNASSLAPGKMVRNELIKALSRLVSMGHVSTEEVFAQIENGNNLRRPTSI